MNQFPLKSLSFYRVRKDFISPVSMDAFTKDTILQFESSVTNIHDCIEICQFVVWGTGEKKVWHFTDMDDGEKMKGWEEFMEQVSRESVVNKL